VSGLFFFSKPVSGDAKAGQAGKIVLATGGELVNIPASVK
jgi:hypothetical protein